MPFKLREANEEEEEGQDETEQPVVAQAPAQGSTAPKPSGINDLLGLDTIAPSTPSQPAPAQPQVKPASLLEAEFFTSSAAPVLHFLNFFSNSNQVAQKEVILPAANGGGMELRGGFLRRNNQVVLELTIANQGSQQPITQIAMQFNKNRLDIFSFLS